MSRTGLSARFRQLFSGAHATLRAPRFHHCCGRVSVSSHSRLCGRIQGSFFGSSSRGLCYVGRRTHLVVFRLQSCSLRSCRRSDWVFARPLFFFFRSSHWLRHGRHFDGRVAFRRCFGPSLQRSDCWRENPGSAARHFHCGGWRRKQTFFSLRSSSGGTGVGWSTSWTRLLSQRGRSVGRHRRQCRAGSHCARAVSKHFRPRIRIFLSMLQPRDEPCKHCATKSTRFRNPIR